MYQQRRGCCPPPTWPKGRAAPPLQSITDLPMMNGDGVMGTMRSWRWPRRLL
jgi:hypothetical protein